MHPLDNTNAIDECGRHSFHMPTVSWAIRLYTNLAPRTKSRVCNSVKAKKRCEELSPDREESS